MSRKKDNICHLVYRINGRDDIVHRFSPKGYELLSEEFLSYPELLRPEIDDNSPVLLEITGVSLPSEDQQAVERAVRVHYQLRLAEAFNSLKDCRLRIHWFSISLIISSILLFAVKNEDQELLVQFAYLPFWFFAYRILTYPIYDYIPGLRNARWLERLASAKLVFTETPLENISEELKQQTICETHENTAKARSRTLSRELVDSYFLEDNMIALETEIGSAEDLLDPHCISGHERISTEFSSWLEQALPFVTPERNVKLTIHNSDREGHGRRAVAAGLKNYFSLSLAAAKQDKGLNDRRIGGFTIGLALASVLLLLWGSRVDVATHETILILLWFYGDYLVEYVLLTDRQLKDDLHRREKLKDMHISFD